MNIKRVSKRNAANTSVLVTALFCTFLSSHAMAADFIISEGEGFDDTTVVTVIDGNTGTTVGEQRSQVMAEAARIWTEILQPATDIYISVDFSSLTCTSTSATLGAAGAISVFRNFTNAPLRNTYYVSALYRALTGNNSTSSSVRAYFNSNLTGSSSCLAGKTWYYGFEGNNSSSELDLLTVTLHELAHGLGFSSLASATTGAKFNGGDDAFMVNLNDVSTNKNWSDMTDAERVTSAINDGNLIWIGSEVEKLISDTSNLLLSKGKNGNGVRMYAPTTVSSGSSVSHFDTDVKFVAGFATHELMEPSYTSSWEKILTAAVFRDMGWPNSNIDTDSDGTTDGKDAFPMDSAETTDTDEDGIGDNIDNCPLVSNSDQKNHENDGNGDVCDDDDDNDGILDAADNCPLGDTGWTSSSTTDVDGDGCQDSSSEETDIDESPVVTAPVDLTIEATGATTAVDLGTAAVVDELDGTLIATADNTGPFTVGTHTIIWSATDSAGNTATAIQTLIVQDTTAPTITVPASQTVEAIGGGIPVGVVVGIATATDLVDGTVTVSSDSPPFFFRGTTTITWTATDNAGNTAAAKQTITVSDTTAPSVSAPPDQTVEATGMLTTVNLGSAFAIDLVDAVTPAADKSSPFTLGTHTITWSATDSSGNTGTDTQTIVIEDTTAPSVTAPADQTITATGTLTSVISGTATVTDLVDSNPVVTASPTGPFAIGTHTITWTAIDASGNSATAAQTITINNANICGLDIDGDNNISPLSDGLLLLRYLFGFSGDSLIDSAVSADAERNSADQILSYLTTCLAYYDIDGDGAVQPLSDGLLILRYEFGFSGDSLIDNVIGDTAIRSNASSIENYLAALATGTVTADEDTGTDTATVDLVSLGEKLYFDTSLSVPAGQSCASCHTPSAGFADPDSGSPTSLGADSSSLGSRNSPTASYAAHIPDAQTVARPTPDGGTRMIRIGGQFLDGRAASLEEQAKGPFLNSVEMANASKSDVIDKIKLTDYASDFESLFGVNILNDVDTSYDHVADAIAAFERSSVFSPFTSKFDQVAAGQATFTAAEARGQRLFNRKAQCNACHTSPANSQQVFSDFQFRNIGVPSNPALLNMLNDPDLIDNGLGGVTHNPRDNGKFRTPNLRNIAITAPYMHNGVFNTLTEVVEFYNTRDTTFVESPEVSQNLDQGGNIGELGLTDNEIQDLVSFLETLTDRTD